MTTSRRELITTAIFNIVKDTTGLAGRVYRSRVEAFSRNSTPALVIECMKNDIGLISLPAMKQQLELRFMLLIDHPIPEQAADPILVDLHSRLMNDLTLGGLAMEITPGITRWDLEVNGLAVVATSYLVSYRTPTKDLASG